MALCAWRVRRGVVARVRGCPGRQAQRARTVVGCPPVCPAALRLCADASPGSPRCQLSENNNSNLLNCICTKPDLFVSAKELTQCGLRLHWGKCRQKVDPSHLHKIPSICLHQSTFIPSIVKTQGRKCLLSQRCHSICTK